MNDNVHLVVTGNCGKLHTYKQWQECAACARPPAPLKQESYGALLEETHPLEVISTYVVEAAKGIAFIGSLLALAFWACVIKGG